MRVKFIPALRQKRGVDVDTVICQQEGATLHCSNTSLEYLHHYFPRETLISCHIGTTRLACTFSRPNPLNYLLSVGIPKRQDLC